MARLAAKASRAHGIGAREKYSARLCPVGHDLDDVRIEEFFGIGDCMRCRCNLAVRAALEQASHVVDHRSRDQWLVALDVDDDLLRAQPKRVGRLGQPIGAGFMLRRRKHGDDAMGLAGRDDLITVGRDHDAVGPGRLRALRDADHHRRAADVGERLARQSGRRQPRRDDDDKTHETAAAGDGRSAPEFVQGDLAGLGLEHHRDAVADRIRKGVGLADKFLRILVKIERPLADRAYEDVKQPVVHAGPFEGGSVR